MICFIYIYNFYSLYPLDVYSSAAWLENICCTYYISMLVYCFSSLQKGSQGLDFLGGVQEEVV